MTAYTTYGDGQTIANPKFTSSEHSAPGKVFFEGVFDASRRNLAMGDDVTVLWIPPGTHVHRVFYKIETPEATATRTIDIGVTGTVDGWANGLDATVAAGTLGQGVGTSYGSGAGTIYSAQTALKLTATDNAIATLKIRVIVEGSLLA